MHPKGAARRVWLQGAQKLIEALVIAHSEHSRVGTSDGESAWTARLLKILETSANIAESGNSTVDRRISGLVATDLQRLSH